ncbi:helix-turn-helix transcriptional regulator [Paenibacillus sp. UNC451MF]|uniref:helix-turn-helix transcriptional regulator n=1 Tax=Paenibacillus sp. UNC451MF TaxID=1449063 RepID=UPI00048C02BB|nr:AraC family transcriptional regulator [Paenibacillus sp. UNC451MF]
MKSKVLSVYFGSRTYQSFRELHTHEYWQLEIVTQGVIQSRMLGEELSLEMGDMLLVPPGWEHGFTYNKQGVSWLTLKFEREEDDLPVWGGIIHGNQFTSRLVSSFKTVIHESPYRSYEKTFINGFLETMLHYVRSDEFHRTDDSSELLVKLVMEKVNKRNGRAITINELAEELSYTRSHLSKKFKEITGENLKSYIDHVRIQKIEELLRYREQSISEIAEDLGFNDLFSFSKFFKKHTGESPRQFNRKFASWRTL